MIELKEAVQAAEQYLRALMPEADELQVEEVELTSRDERTERPDWTITLSFIRPFSKHDLVTLGPRQRTYKEFHIVGGEVRSMKIRELSGA